MGIVNKLSNIENSPLKVRVGPAGLHFFNRTTGMNILVDEIRPPSHLWSTAPRQVSIALTNSCDLACPHCYAPKYAAMLAFNRLTSWLVDLDSNGCIGVGFGGGEPTLCPWLVDICSFAVGTTNLAVTMTTHAHRLSNQLLSELEGTLHFVRVSMDGVGSTYESIRGRPFDALLERITALSRITPFGINYGVFPT
jgi:MoaA/NifB/PqqE/SkfB family radical SAM enzyme